LLDFLERRVPVRPPWVEIPEEAGDEAIVFGDSHGDWRSTQEVVQRYREGKRLLVGLGDYVDRPPDDCGAGSVANALFLLELVAQGHLASISSEDRFSMAYRKVLAQTIPSEQGRLAARKRGGPGKHVDGHPGAPHPSTEVSDDLDLVASREPDPDL
jgi:hypothetical protein